MREASRCSGYMPLSGAASGRPLMINSVSRRGHRQILLATFSRLNTAFPQLMSPFQATRRRNLGLGIFSPPEVAAKSLMPRSTPTTAPVAGSCTGSAASTAKETYQRPHGSRETVTVDGPADAGSMPGQDQVNSSGVPILARNSWPPRYRKPDRVYSADCRPLRDLYRGYRARPAKKLLNATCWCRIACWSGTEDTSFSQPRSSVAFIAVR